MSALEMSESVISVEGVSKSFRLYSSPVHRLREILWSGFAYLAPNGLRSRLQAKGGSRAVEFSALKNVSFTVCRGETVGIIGRNGSGKSTLLQIICGTLPPTTGRVKVNGKIAALLELGSGFNPDYTGRENVYLNGQLLGLSKPQIDERFSDIEDFAEIGEHIDQPVKTYSSGMFVRLAFAIIAHVDADILVIDEALAVGDAFFGQKCMRFLRDFMKTKTVLFVSHDTGSVRSLCSRAIWLERGEPLEIGASKAVCDLYLQAFIEERQGKSAVTRLKSNYKRQDVESVDQRLKYVNNSNLRNDLQVFKFDESRASFGDRRMRISDALFVSEDGQPNNWIVGGERVRLRVVAEAFDSLKSVIVGFYVKDRLGQVLFGDNTYLTFQDAPINVSAGEFVSADFCFDMPTLPKGDYTVSAAVASGTQIEHIHHDYVLDAFVFRGEADGTATGMIGIPMTEIALSVRS
jgi:lipopolysaccharide transport system ATP-binding protein